MRIIFPCLFLFGTLIVSAKNKDLYWVSYKRNQKLESVSSAIVSRTAYLQWHTEKLHHSLFANKPGTYFWLAEASLVSLENLEIQSLKNDSRILSIKPAGRRARLVQENPQTAETFTYGLKNIHLPELWRFYPNINGSGVRVGVIDTGADNLHPDLRGKIAAFRDFTDPSKKTSYDDHGHGSHVSGTIAGGNFSGKFIGVAPEAKLIIAKAFDRRGNSQDTGLIASLQWMADPDENPSTQDQPQVVSNSWEISSEDLSQKDPQDEIFCRTLHNLKALGITPVFAAGNSGPSAGTVNLPAACPGVLAVGATDQKDKISEFSSRGPVQWKTGRYTKPEVVAPGVGIYSAEIGGDYTTKSGTSMATPHVAGLLALMKQVAPQIMPDDLAQALISSTRDINGSTGVDNTYGWGIIDAVQATQKVLESSFTRMKKIIGHNDLIEVRSDLSNLPSRFHEVAEAIGYTNYLCTVTHIGNGYALSAGHCFDAKEYLETDMGCSFVEVKWGYREGKAPTLESKCEKIVARQNSGELDFAILKMKTYPRYKVNLNLDSSLSVGGEVTILSHPDGGVLQWSQSCLITADPHPKIPPELLKYACDTNGGSSGAVLLDWNTAEGFGLHKGGWPEMNYGTRVDVSQLKEILKKLNLQGEL